MKICVGNRSYKQCRASAQSDNAAAETRKTHLQKQPIRPRRLHSASGCLLLRASKLFGCKRTGRSLETKNPISHNLNFQTLELMMSCMGMGGWCSESGYPAE